MAPPVGVPPVIEPPVDDPPIELPPVPPFELPPVPPPAPARLPASLSPTGGALFVATAHAHAAHPANTSLQVPRFGSTSLRNATNLAWFIEAARLCKVAVNASRSDPWVQIPARADPDHLEIEMTESATRGRVGRKPMRDRLQLRDRFQSRPRRPGAFPLEVTYLFYSASAGLLENRRLEHRRRKRRPVPSRRSGCSPASVGPARPSRVTRSGFSRPLAPPSRRRLRSSRAGALRVVGVPRSIRETGSRALGTNPSYDRGARPPDPRFRRTRL
jgi:hypothetical protein